ncbi:MAG: RidA family protein [Hyphomicrobiaceae bacterium]
MSPTFHFMQNAPKPVAPYSHAVEVDGFVFVTGQLATDPDDDARPVPEGIEAQTHKVMDNLGRVLKGVGLDFRSVITVRIFLTAFERDYATMNAIYASYFDPNRLPARTTVGVTHLARGGIVEIDLIAKRG